MEGDREGKGGREGGGGRYGRVGRREAGKGKGGRGWRNTRNEDSRWIGKERPSISNTGQSPKYSEKRVVSMVADISTTRS